MRRLSVVILAVLAISVAASQSSCMASCIEKLTKVQSYLPKDRINEKCLRICGLGHLRIPAKSLDVIVKKLAGIKRSSNVLGNSCMTTCVAKLTKVQSNLPNNRINEKCLRMCGLGGFQFSKDKIKGLKKTYELVKNQIYKKRSSKVLGNSCMTTCVARLTKVQSNLPKNRINEKCLRMCGLGAVNLGTYTDFTMNH